MFPNNSNDQLILRNSSNEQTNGLLHIFKDLLQSVNPQQHQGQSQSNANNFMRFMSKKMKQNQPSTQPPFSARGAGPAHQTYLNNLLQQQPQSAGKQDQ